MKKCLKIIGKLFLKACFAIAFACLSVFNLFIRVATFIYRLLVVPVAFLAVFMTVSEFSEYGMTLDTVKNAIMTLTMIALYFTLPYVPTGIAFMKEILLDAIRTPMVIKSPVKYTI